MHTKIVPTSNLARVLWYHENKVKQGVAECIYAANMIKDVDDLTTREKQFNLERLLTLNDRVRQKVLHVFVAFHESDKIDKPNLRSLARDYMQGMGWERQPWLAYLHRDSLYTHLHIVSSRIRWNEPPIPFSLSNVFKSYAVSRQLEKQYGLYQAGIRIPDEEWRELHPVQALEKGTTSQRATMNAIMDFVIPNYNYTNLEELNAVLELYRVRASTGEPGGTIRQAGGLVYYPLTEDGRLSKPYIKASHLQQRPTLQKLAAQFEINRGLRQQQEERVTTAVDWVLYDSCLDLDAFKEALGNERISLVMDGETNRQKVWYVDHKDRVVHSGESLGQRYSASGLLERLVPKEVYHQELNERLALHPRRGQRISGDL
jgi:hypothetical protein